MARPKSRILKTCLWIAVVALSASSALANANEKPDFARGARLYSENCGRCHNARGPSEFSDASWPLIITHMRVTAGLPGEQARTIEAFLRASNNPPPRRLAVAKVAPETPASKLSGEDLLQQYGCRGCHQIGGSGGTIGPDLAGLFDRRSQDWIRVQIQTPRVHNSKTLMPVFGLTDPQVAAIVKALRTPQSQ